MRPGAPTLLLPVAGVSLARLRASIASRLARRELAQADVLRDLSDPPKQGAQTKSDPTEVASETAGRLTGAMGLPTLGAIARVRPPAEAVARSRYRGEMFWFESRAWAVFADPEDADCRYAQEVA